MSKNKKASSEDGMSAGDAATTTVFGIGLPSWDVYSDILNINSIFQNKSHLFFGFLGRTVYGFPGIFNEDQYKYKSFHDCVNVSM